MRETEREVKGDVAVTETTLLGTFKSSVVTKIKEWFWKFTVSHRRFLVAVEMSLHNVVLGVI